MSMITEQVEKLRELSKQDKLGLIPWNGYSEILNQAADTIEQLAAIKTLEQEPCDVFDEYGNYKYPGDVELTEPNTATSMPCEDAISRQAAIDAIYKMHMNGKEGVLHDLKTETGSDAFFAETMADAVEALEDLPPVNPQPKTGHWIGIDEEPHEDYECDKCGYVIWADENIEKFHYCPNCGAKMIEPQETETWNGIHAQITAPKGTFERIFNEADDDSDI